jgi:hypothetical protein
MKRFSSLPLLIGSYYVVISENVSRVGPRRSRAGRISNSGVEVSTLAETIAM